MESNCRNFISFPYVLPCESVFVRVCVWIVNICCKSRKWESFLNICWIDEAKQPNLCKKRPNFAFVFVPSSIFPFWKFIEKWMDSLECLHLYYTLGLCSMFIQWPIQNKIIKMNFIHISITEWLLAKFNKLMTW